MEYIIDKLKNFFKIVLKYLKSLIISFLGFFFNLFNNKNISKKKVKRENNIKYQNKLENKTVDTSGLAEESGTRTTNDNLSFNVSNEELEYLILTLFCKELELKKIDLTNTQKEYIKSLNEKIIPVIQHDIAKQYINNTNALNDEIKKLVICELENQFKLEQNNELPTSKIIITTLLDKNNNIESKLNTEETFLSSKRNNAKTQIRNVSLTIFDSKNSDKSDCQNNCLVNQSINNINDKLTDKINREKVDTLSSRDYRSSTPNYAKSNEVFLDTKTLEIKMKRIFLFSFLVIKMKILL